MSYPTVADTRLDSALGHVQEAIKDITDVVINECPGHLDYASDYKVKLYDILTDLIKCKKNLDKGS